ncbi:feruloyl-CoA synthase [Acidihalobacter yilgarnensis]|uniref:feruloyl-CoA synthase n=1 Tax=Acidihalobacter yilgarnensis TaxID=2819280 RepID=UPI0009F1980A|nr:feruloyl-CoA synthase [Acidihalobacter yilgarnensis]
MNIPPYRPVRLADYRLILDSREDGTHYLRNEIPLGPYPTCITERLTEWASRAPERLFLVDRDTDEQWRGVTYREALSMARRLGQALLDRGLSPERPLVILSGNDLEHGLLALAAQHVGIPFAPLAPAYSLNSPDYAKLRHALSLLTPGMVYFSDGAAYRHVLDLLDQLPEPCERVCRQHPPPGQCVRLFSELAATTPTSAVETAHAAINGDTIAKFLFTSGSTGWPKAVINTQRMLCSNQQMKLQSWPCMTDEPPVLVDWLPWSHTFGGNHNFGLVLYNGGTLYIDDGSPTPKGIGRTLRNLREIAPTLYFNVPRGYELLIPSLMRDQTLSARFFERLRMCFYAGAHLRQHTWEAWDHLGTAHCGSRILMMTGLGATETAPFALCANRDSRQSGLVGLPVPGVELKLAPCQQKLEARIRGPNVTPGYWRQPGLSVDAFDDEGFYRLGDALRFLDPLRPQAGLLFDGRVAEDFKLVTGTWVSVGPLRAKLVEAGAPHIREAVITGQDQNTIGALIFPDIDACRQLAGATPSTDKDHILAHPRVRERFAGILEQLASSATGSSTRLTRLLLVSDPLSPAHNELTDKGTVNQRAVLERRRELVEALYGANESAYRITLNNRHTTPSTDTCAVHHSYSTT